MPFLRLLKPGDVLLYNPKGLFGWFIRIKTWHKIAHCEVYVGDGFSVASRDGIGVGRYPLRTAQLHSVCRPKPDVPFDLARALRWFDRQKGTPYGWADLLQFAGFNVDAQGIVCSPFCARFLRNGGLDPFNGEQAEKLAPFQFELSNCFHVYDVTDEALVLREWTPEQEPAA